MIDGLDGFELTPSQGAVKRMRYLGLGLLASSALVIVLFAVFALASGRSIWWLATGVYLALSVPADWVLWRVMQPPGLRADGTMVTCKSGFRTITVPRSDLASIHAGLPPRGRGRASSVRSYVFSDALGSALFTIPAMWFGAGDMRAFGERLGLPVSERL